MNLRFLGDVLDHWKGSMISQLSKAKLLDQLKVDQLASDFSQWGEVDHRLYAELLRIHRSALVAHKQELWKNRNAYLEEILAVEGDMFLDPDIGISTNSQAGPEHLKASELHSILDHAPKRIVMVYQHIRARKTRDRVLEIMYSLQQKGPGFHACSYESATVAMLFFSRRAERLDPIGKYYQRMLDWHARRRIWHWQSPSTTLRLVAHH